MKASKIAEILCPVIEQCKQDKDTFLFMHIEGVKKDEPANTTNSCDMNDIDHVDVILLIEFIRRNQPLDIPKLKEAVEAL